MFSPGVAACNSHLTVWSAVDGETTADQAFVSEPSTAILPSNEVLPPVGSSNETTSA